MTTLFIFWEQYMGRLFMKKMILFLSLILIMSCFSVPVLAVNYSGSTPSGVPLSALEQFVDSYTAEYIGTTTAGASIVVLKDGEVLLSKAYGYADIENAVEVDTDTVFDWGSDTKLLVWTSVMQLVEQGKLDLNADIRGYLPDVFFTKLQFDSPITMYNLMHHNAGWEDCYTDLFYHSAEDVLSLEETLRITEPKQVKEPGAVVAYSNYGVALAGYIVERVSGQPFYEYVNENIFAVLGMNDTSIHPIQLDDASVAARREKIHGYTISGDKLTVSKNERIFIGLYPAGSAIGTADDAAKFLAALMPGEGEPSLLFMSNDTLNKMLSTSHSYAEDFPGISHGFWGKFGAVKTLGHGGNTDSFSSYFTIAPEAGLGLVVMTNQANETGLCTGLAKALFGEYSSDYTGDLPDAHEFEGSYIIARRPYNGFSKLMGYLSVYDVNAIDNDTLEMAGIRFTQISPYIFQNDGSSEGFDLPDLLYFTMEDGNVVRVSMPYMELLPVTGYEKSVMIISTIFAVACVPYLIATIFIIVIGGIRNRKKGVPSSLIKKLNMSLNLAGAVALINTAIMAIRALQYSSYAALRVHFGINITYMVFAPLCICLMVANRKKVEISKAGKLFYISSCIVSIILILLLIVWELYK